MEREKGKLRNKEVGIISIVTVVSQIVSGNISTSNVNQELMRLHREISDFRIERSEHYVNKSDFHILEVKVDKANDQLLALKLQSTSLKEFLKSKLHYSYFTLPHNEQALNEFTLLPSKKR